MLAERASFFSSSGKPVPEVLFFKRPSSFAKMISYALEPRQFCILCLVSPFVVNFHHTFFGWGKDTVQTAKHGEQKYDVAVLALFEVAAHGVGYLPYELDVSERLILIYINSFLA